MHQLIDGVSDSVDVCGKKSPLSVTAENLGLSIKD
jgi:hypothetical protein